MEWSEKTLQLEVNRNRFIQLKTYENLDFETYIDSFVVLAWLLH